MPSLQSRSSLADDLGDPHWSDDLWLRLGKFLFGHLRCHQEILLVVLTVTDVPRVGFEWFAQSQQKSTLRLAISSIDLSQKWWQNNYISEKPATLCLGFCHQLQNVAARANGRGDFSLCMFRAILRLGSHYFHAPVTWPTEVQGESHNTSHTMPQVVFVTFLKQEKKGRNKTHFPALALTLI